MRGSVVMIYKPKRQYEIVYYESIKRELKRRLINEGRCDERLKAKVEESTCLGYTGLHDKTN